MPILGGTGAHYRGVRCPLQGGQVPNIGGLGAQCSPHLHVQQPLLPGAEVGGREPQAARGLARPLLLGPPWILFAASEDAI
jgi:hypothetical protein